jgi:Holliday junction resolvase-like predicted endonuclease
MQNAAKTGKIGEKIAGLFLIRKGFKIIAQNHKEGFDEIDIIAKDRVGALVFFEVKTLIDNGYFKDGLMPEDNLTTKKIQRISRACRNFAVRNEDIIDDRLGWRIDLIAITLNGARDKVIDLKHYENIT